LRLGTNGVRDLDLHCGVWSVEKIDGTRHIVSPLNAARFGVTNAEKGPVLEEPMASSSTYHEAFSRGEHMSMFDRNAR